MKAINLAEKLALVENPWDPHVVADYNDNDVMVAKFKGEFPFHIHEDTDDFFLILEGRVLMDIDGEPSKWVGPGEIFVVPRGVRHRPRAEEEVTAMLIQPKGEPNTGDSGAPASSKPRI